MNHMASDYAYHLSDVILGGQDGLVNVLGLSIGVMGATADPKLVIVSGLAAMFAESISMGAVAYTSSKAALDYEKKAALAASMSRPETERILLRLRGIGAEKLRYLRARLLAPHEPSNGSPLSKGAKVWLATMAGSLVPLWPYFFFEVHAAVALSVLSAALVLFSTGALKARWTVGSWMRSGFEMVLVGSLAALAGYAIGLLLRAPA